MSRCRIGTLLLAKLKAELERRQRILRIYLLNAVLYSTLFMCKKGHRYFTDGVLDEKALCVSDS